MASVLGKASKRRPVMIELPQAVQMSKGASVAEKRRLIAEFCRALGMQIGTVRPIVEGDGKITERMRETLQHLLNGDSEKQVARKLGLSRNTVHVYVKNLYRHFGVSSRAELLAKCLRPLGRGATVSENRAR